MHTIKWADRATREYDRLKAEAQRAEAGRRKAGRRKSSRQEGLFRQVHKAIRLLAQDPRHPGLQTHVFESMPNPFDPSRKVFEAYAQNKTPGAYRVFWCYGPGKNEITLIAITPHP